jgi:protein-disulfide isomerase
LTCITDGKMREQVTKTAYEAGSRGIASTPSFVINGGVYEGFMSSEVLGKIALGK